MISSQAGARWPASFTGPGTDGGYFLDSADSGAASCPRKDGLYCSYGSKKCEPVLEDGRSCSHTSYCSVTCQPLEAMGQACTKNGECKNERCDGQHCVDNLVVPPMICTDGFADD